MVEMQQVDPPSGSVSWLHALMAPHGFTCRMPCGTWTECPTCASRTWRQTDSGRCASQAAGLTMKLTPALFNGAKSTAWYLHDGGACAPAVLQYKQPASKGQRDRIRAARPRPPATTPRTRLIAENAANQPAGVYEEAARNNARGMGGWHLRLHRCGGSCDLGAAKLRAAAGVVTRDVAAGAASTLARSLTHADSTDERG